MSLHLVTGHVGSAHVTSADQGALNACLFGTEDYVLNSGSNFAASIITNNQIRIADGELMMQGRHIRLAKDTYEDVVIENGTQSMNRNDLIIVRYTKNAESGIETATFVVIKGTETTGTASDPEYTTGDILAGDCVLHEMPLYRVPLTGLTVGEPVQLFDTEQVLAENRQKLNFIGSNPITSTADDTPANWVALGTGHAYINGSGKLNSQPVTYGVLENIVVKETVFQTFISYTTGSVGTKWTRSGKTGWNVWVKSLDENTGIQMELAWQNASPTSGFDAQTIALALSEDDKVLIRIRGASDRAYYGHIALLSVGESGYLASHAGGVNCIRGVSVTTTGIHFQKSANFGTYGNFTETSTTTGAIPSEIYIIKGVQ